MLPPATWRSQTSHPHSSHYQLGWASCLQLSTSPLSRSPILHPVVAKSESPFWCWLMLEVCSHLPPRSLQRRTTRIPHTELSSSDFEEEFLPLGLYSWCSKIYEKESLSQRSHSSQELFRIACLTACYIWKPHRRGLQACWNLPVPSGSAGFSLLFGVARWTEFSSSLT